MFVLKILILKAVLQAPWSLYLEFQRVVKLIQDNIKTL